MENQTQDTRGRIQELEAHNAVQRMMIGQVKFHLKDWRDSRRNKVMTILNRFDETYDLAALGMTDAEVDQLTILNNQQLVDVIRAGMLAIKTVLPKESQN